MIKDTYPAVKAVALTADAANDLATVPTRGLYVGAGGDIIVDMFDVGSTITFVAVPTGTLLPIAIKRLRQGTSCVALY